MRLIKKNTSEGGQTKASDFTNAPKHERYQNSAYQHIEESCTLNSVIIRTSLGAFFTALVSAVFAISFAAIIYTGDLSQFLDRGIGLTLLGAVVISLVGAVTLSYRGGILGPQDLPAILLASGAAGVAAQTHLGDEAVFATVTCLVALTSLVTGLLGYLFGTFRIAYLARFIPYPVLAGFLASTGLLLFVGGINISLGSYEVITWMDYVSTDAVLRWVPMVCIALAMVIVTRKFNGFLVMPVTLFAALAAFYTFYIVMGISMKDLAAHGFLLGPFHDGGFIDAIDPSLPLRADWPTIFQYAPLIITAALSAIIGATLNASGLELALNQDFDINQEMAGSGIANVLSGLCGGIPGYHVVGETLLANRLGLFGAAAGISSASACGLLLVLGGAVLSNLPIGFFAAVIAFLGIDLLFSWLWQERRKMGLLDYGIVLLIPLTAITFGFLTAISVGLMMACALFILEYGRLETIHSKSDMSTRRSLLERPDTELDVLSETGKSALIIELSTFLFFGSANTLRQKVRTVLEEGPNVSWLILDFRRVHGLDVSTRHVLQRIESDCKETGQKLVLTALPSGVSDELKERTKSIQTCPALEDAIEMIEDHMIQQATQEGAIGTGVSDQLETLIAQTDSYGYTERMTVEVGTVVIEKNSRSQDIYLLLSGKLCVIDPNGGLEETVVAYIQPGAVVGEMAGYSQRPRTATIIADETSELIRINLDLIFQLEQERPDITTEFHRLIAADMARRLDRTTALLRDLQT
ncbi:SulP family inorganic anion transporter [uncultured Ruegeria sp.]|uniref:SulP family inorganic anion transporter n=1 Tax=uncultured Ruegeria sp. TaxID=259304 RepID=UPI002611FA96|nr:SulP family inorganic anion transporter [uncultured Ruegeria sp.]